MRGAAAAAPASWGTHSGQWAELAREYKAVSPSLGHGLACERRGRTTAPASESLPRRGRPLQRVAPRQKLLLLIRAQMGVKMVHGACGHRSTSSRSREIHFGLGRRRPAGEILHTEARTAVKVRLLALVSSCACRRPAAGRLMESRSRGAEAPPGPEVLHELPAGVHEEARARQSCIWAASQCFRASSQSTSACWRRFSAAYTSRISTSSSR